MHYYGPVAAPENNRPTRVGLALSMASMRPQRGVGSGGRAPGGSPLKSWWHFGTGTHFCDVMEPRSYNISEIVLHTCRLGL